MLDAFYVDSYYKMNAPWQLSHIFHWSPHIPLSLWPMIICCCHHVLTG